MLPALAHFATLLQAFLELIDEEEAFDYNLSGEEEPTLDRPRSMGLFHHELFKTLLQKAKATANMGVKKAPSEGSSEPTDSNTLLFTEAVTEQDVILPKLFVDTIQRQWSQPYQLLAAWTRSCIPWSRSSKTSLSFPQSMFQWLV